jgi:hypothetical protein
MQFAKHTRALAAALLVIISFYSLGSAVYSKNQVVKLK